MFVLIEVGLDQEGDQEYWEPATVLCAKPTRDECVEHMTDYHNRTGECWMEDYGMEIPPLVESSKGNFTYTDPDGDPTLHHGYQIQEV